MNTSSKRKNFNDIKDKDYCDPDRRMDFVLFFEATHANPNGDPDAGNLPRVDPTDNHGIVTDVATKRKIRDYLQAALGQEIFIQNKTALNTLYFKVANDAADDASIDNTKRESIRALAVKLTVEEDSDYRTLLAENCGTDDDPKSFADCLAEIELGNAEFDPATQEFRFLGESKGPAEISAELVGESDFDDAISERLHRTGRGKKPGLVQLLKVKKAALKKAGTKDGREAMKEQMYGRFADIRLFGAVLTAGTNAGQIRGPMQLTFARSLQPIVPVESSITRCAITKASDALKKETEMGRKPWVSWAAYEQHGFYNAPLGAAKNGTGVTREDLARFWEAVANMFPEAQAAKGEMHVCELIVFVHDGPRGCAPFHKLRGKLNLDEREGVTEETKGFENRYKTPLTITDEEKLKTHGISVYRPLADLGYDI
jgi:CRISPR-associated protein Csd2